MWKRAHLYIFGERVHPCLFLAGTLARCPSRPSFHRLAARYRTCSSASLHAARARQATRTSHDARQRGIDRAYAAQDREEGRGAGGEEGERHMCH
jgi:hypothetical protein